MKTVQLRAQPCLDTEHGTGRSVLLSGWSAGRTVGKAQGWWVRPPLPGQSSPHPLQVWSAYIGISARWTWGHLKL